MSEFRNPMTYGQVLVKSPYGEWRPYLSMSRPLLCHELLGHAINEFAPKGLNRDMEWYLLYRTEDGTSVRCEPGAVVEPLGTYVLVTSYWLWRHGGPQPEEPAKETR